MRSAFYRPLVWTVRLKAAVGLAIVVTWGSGIPVAAQTPTATPTATASPTASATAASQPDLRALVVQFWQGTVSSGDVAGAAAFFTPDATRYDNGTVLAVGRDAIQASFARQAANHPSFNVLSVQVTGNTTVARSERRDDAERAAGIDRIIIVSTAEWRGDKIFKLDAIRDLTDPQTAQFTAQAAAAAAAAAPAQAAPAPPKTGNAGLVTSTPPAWPIVLMLATAFALTGTARWLSGIPR